MTSSIKLDARAKGKKILQKDNKPASQIVQNPLYLGGKVREKEKRLWQYPTIPAGHFLLDFLLSQLRYNVVSQIRQSWLRKLATIWVLITFLNYLLKKKKKKNFPSGVQWNRENNLLTLLANETKLIKQPRI